MRILWGTEVKGLEAVDGRVRITFEPQDAAPVTVDRVVCALGGTTPQDFLTTIGIEFDGPDPRLGDGFRTSVPGLYLAGDLTAGRVGGSIILAFNNAARAIGTICKTHGICALS